MGEVILKQGIPLTDPFSYTMREFPFVDHEWLTNVAMYKLDLAWGVVGPAFVAATIVAIALALTLDKREDFLAVPMFFGIMGWMGRAGARPQVLDWAFFAGLIYMFEDRNRWKKWRWLWPAIVVIWVNLHGGYAVGVVVLAVMMGVDALQERKIDVKNLVVLGLSVVATLLNPYGLRMWGEVIMQMTDPHVRWTIAEWVPFFVTFEMGFWLLVTQVGFLMVKFWRKIRWWKIAVFLGMIFASMGSVRHIGLAFVIVVPLAVDLLKIMYDEFIKDSEQKKRWRVFYGILLGVSGVLLAWTGYWTVRMTIENTMRDKFYPVAAVEHVKNNPIKDNLFSQYGWGGYLIWKLPEHKLFIDGRMATWRYYDEECEKLKAREGNREACWAMRDFEKASGGEYQELFDRYDVQTVLWPKVSEGRNVLKQLSETIARLFGEVKEPKKSFVDTLREDGWSVVYEDQVAIVLERR